MLSRYFPELGHWMHHVCLYIVFTVHYFFTSEHFVLQYEYYFVFYFLIEQ